MSFLSENELNGLTIERMAFHVVGPGEDQLILLDEVHPGRFGDFFVDRIRSANTGNMFDFVDASATLTMLREVDGDDGVFLRRSQDLARYFHLGHRGNMSVGVFMVFVLKCGLGNRLFSLVKFDHQSVIHYQLQSVAQNAGVVLDEVTNTFVKARDAMQKSALVRLNGTGGEICVVDRGARDGITGYFQSFLGAQRRFAPSELTKRLYDIVVKVAEEHRDDLPPHVVRNIRKSAYDALQIQAGFDPEVPDAFLAAVYGPLDQTSPVRDTFLKRLRSAKISGESFEFDRRAVTRPSKWRKRTVEGVEIIYDKDREDDLISTREMDGQSYVLVRYSRIAEDGYFAEGRKKGN